jgi:Domain of unknown function (DUF4193)
MNDDDNDKDDDAPLDESDVADDDIAEGELADDEDLEKLALDGDDELTDDLDDVEDADVDVDTAAGAEEVVAEVVVEPVAQVAAVAAGSAAGPARRRRGDTEEEDVLDLDEELHPDDVEAPLDALLQEKTASATLEDDEEEIEDEEVDADAPGELPTKIVPRRPGEFLCSSCFLVLPRNQLADERRMLCRDCV